MEVEVTHTLPAVRSSVDHNPVAILQTFLFSKVFYGHQDIPHQPLILRLEISQALDVLLGNDQDMGGRLRVDIAECRQLIGLQQKLCPQLTAADSAEQAI
jgi:hypothetical protein